MSSGSSHKVISLNSIDHASLVVKAMRSKKSSDGRYQDAAVQKGMDVNKLDTAILTVRQHQDQHDAKRAQIEDKMASWTVVSKYVPSSKNSDSENEDSDREGGIPKNYKSQEKARGQRNEEDAMDFDDFDDPDENAELFRGFVAPKSKSGVGSKSTTSKPLSKTSSISLPHPTLMTSKGVVIKPGQAIRVKPVGSRAKLSASEL